MEAFGKEVRTPLCHYGVTVFSIYAEKIVGNIVLYYLTYFRVCYICSISLLNMGH